MYLQIPAHPGEEGGRLLFAHYLWNAGVIAAEAIEQGSHDDEVRSVSDTENDDEQDADDLVKWDKRFWDMRGKAVLELGAGRSTALADFEDVKSVLYPVVHLAINLVHVCTVHAQINTDYSMLMSSFP